MDTLVCVLSATVDTAIRGAIILAKLSIVPVWRGYWENKIGKPHTVPCKVTGRCGSVLVRLIPAPRGTGIVWAPAPKKLLMMAGIDNCYTSARGCTATLGNFAKATFDAISKTYSYLTPDLWKETVFTKSPYQVQPARHLVNLCKCGVCLTTAKASSVFLGIHRPPCKDSHQSFCAEDPGSSCGHHIIFVQGK